MEGQPHLPVQSPGNTRANISDFSNYLIAEVQAQLMIHQTEALVSDLESKEINIELY